jgi:hypothetical protein
LGWVGNRQINNIIANSNAKHRSAILVKGYKSHG